MSAIYDQHDKAFRTVSAFAILSPAGEPVAKVAIKYPADGAGRLYAYVHWVGIEMTRGHANGYGYDKASAATFVAARLIKDDPSNESLSAFLKALRSDDGRYWHQRLEAVGFRVFQTV